MKKTEKTTVEVSKNGTPTTGNGQSQALILSKKKLTVLEKIDKIQSFESLSGRHDYLTTKKRELDQFGKSQNGFNRAVLILEDDDNNEVKVSNPIIVEELITIAKMRCQEQIIKTEKEIESFEV